MLSDITESNGRELMHSMLDESATPARTRIQWPYQPSPTKAAWKVWAKSMRTLYITTMTTNMLHTPLGLWLPYPSTQHKSDWYACPDKLDLYRKHGTRWQRFRIQHQQQHYALYDTTPDATTRKLPPTATPATPGQNPTGNMIILLLPIHPWQSTDTLSKQNTDNSSDSDDESVIRTSILDRLMTPPTRGSELWHRITCLSHHDTLNTSLITGQPVVACSDASVDTANFSTFSWIIHCKHALWQGEGIVPGLVEDLYSGRSEAFGILTTLQFLSNYLANYLANYPNTYQT